MRLPAFLFKKSGGWGQNLLVLGLTLGGLFLIWWLRSSAGQTVVMTPEPNPPKTTARVGLVIVLVGLGSFLGWWYRRPRTTTTTVLPSWAQARPWVFVLLAIAGLGTLGFLATRITSWPKFGGLNVWSWPVVEVVVAAILTIALIAGIVTLIRQKKWGRAVILLVVSLWLIPAWLTIETSGLPICNSVPTKATKADDGHPGVASSQKIFRAPPGQWSPFQLVVKPNHLFSHTTSGAIEIETASGSRFHDGPGIHLPHWTANTEAEAMWRFRSLTGREETLTFTYWKK